MSKKTKYYYIASMDIEPEKETLLNEVYDTEHIPALLRVPGVNSITRSVAKPFDMSMGGKTYATYEIESPDVLVSDAWAEAVESGRWPEKVRPYTSNRRQVLRKIII